MPRIGPTRVVVYILALLCSLALLQFLRTNPPSGTVKIKGVGYPTKWPSIGRPAAAAPAFLPPRPDAAFVILCRNADLSEILFSLNEVEQTFNAHPLTAYPYVFLNDDAFNARFRDKVSTYLAAARHRFGGPTAPRPDIRWGRIPASHWDPPPSVNMTKAHTRWERMKAASIPYAMSLSYRNMCRWQSGFFYKHPLVRNLQYYWRIEPSTRFSCNLVPSQGRTPVKWDANADGRGDFFDPFRWMSANGKMYGWTLSLKEYHHTIRSLWPKTRQWMLEHPQYHSPNLTLLPFVLKQDKIGYNMCHFWTNFEIASLSFFRSEAYQAYFDYIDSTGMFYYDRVGDAPFHTIAAAWLLGKDQVHQFENIGYFHAPFTACPRGPQYQGTCACSQFQRFDYDMSNYTCQLEWDSMAGINSTAKILDINKQLGFPEISEFAVLEGYQRG